MNREDVRRKFESIHNVSEYVRVSDKHPLELYIGKNEQGYPTLRYNGAFQPVKVVGNSMLEIKQVRLINTIKKLQVQIRWTELSIAIQ